MLKLKRVAVDTHYENVAYLSRGCKVYRAEGFRALDKIEVSQDGSRILATLNITDDGQILADDELGLSEQAFRRLGLAEGTPVWIAQAQQPRSVEAVRAKIQGATLSGRDFDSIIRDIVANRYSKMEIAAFLVSSAAFLSTEETLELTRAMARNGNQLRWPHPLIVDKHCIGGIPGNRTSMLVVPIVAAHGLPIPKTSSRAITSPAGTADTMEVLARVDLSLAEMQDVVERTKGCLVWGGHMNLAPADDMLISVERPLGIDTPEQLVASILAKKLAAGSTHLVIDIPVGPTAKLRDSATAIRLRKLFEFVGARLGLNLDVVVTHAAQPIGNGIGPVLEARDVMAVLRNEADAPVDLREKSLLLAGRLLEFDPALPGGHGYRLAREILDSGRALAAMERIIAAQGPAPDVLQPGPLTREITAPKDGLIAAVDCLQMARIARLAGAPLDKGAGVDLFVKLGDTVRQGQPLYRIHACFPADFKFAVDRAEESSGITLAD